MEDNMPQSNLIFHQPAQEKHCKQSVENTSITATTMGSGPSNLLVQMMSLNTSGSLELSSLAISLFRARLVIFQTTFMSNNIEFFSMDFTNENSRI